MTLQYLLPLWAIILLLGPLLIVTIVMLVRRDRARMAWLRRMLMVLLLVVVALRPVTPLEGEQTERMNADIFFVVDLTGSMNAEDYDGDSPRLEGVKKDMDRIMSMTEGARYSIIGFDSTATQQLPLTTDAGAAAAWIDTAHTESTALSQGSNIDRPLGPLLTALKEAEEESPDSHRMVYFLSDGENTDGMETQSFSALAAYIDGGGVLGYGTAEGGKMKARGGKSDGKYITDSAGNPGISKIDEKQLQTIAQQLGVPYLHRTAPDESLDETMKGITLKPIPHRSTARVPSFKDWYWIASIPLTLLFIWELGEMTYRLPRHRDRSDLLPREEA